LRDRVDYVTRIAPDSLHASQTWLYEAMCIGWPYRTRNPPRAMPIDARAPAALIVAGTGDPSTSVSWAVGLRCAATSVA
jgi:hypothetical protein